MKIAALCVSPNSIYKQIEGIDCYDLSRDARTFTKNIPVIAHPPCRGWTTFGINMGSKPIPGEKDLAYFCIEKVLNNGGVLEHPYLSNFSKLFISDKRLKTIIVDQSWWGYTVRKRTRLLVPNYYTIPEFPFDLLPVENRQGYKFELMPKWYKQHTVKPFAEWLIHLIEVNHYL